MTKRKLTSSVLQIDERPKSQTLADGLYRWILPGSLLLVIAFGWALPSGQSAGKLDVQSVSYESSSTRCDGGWSGITSRELVAVFKSRTTGVQSGAIARSVWARVEAATKLLVQAQRLAPLRASPDVTSSQIVVTLESGEEIRINWDEEVCIATSPGRHESVQEIDTALCFKRVKMEIARAASLLDNDDQDVVLDAHAAELAHMLKENWELSCKEDLERFNAWMVLLSEPPIDGMDPRMDDARWRYFWKSAFRIVALNRPNDRASAALWLRQRVDEVDCGTNYANYRDLMMVLSAIEGKIDSNDLDSLHSSNPVIDGLMHLYSDESDASWAGFLESIRGSDDQEMCASVLPYVPRKWWDESLQILSAMSDDQDEVVRMTAVTARTYLEISIADSLGGTAGEDSR